MKHDESPFPLHASSNDRFQPVDDLPSSGGSDPDTDDAFEHHVPLPDPGLFEHKDYGPGELFGDERGGQTPTLPPRRTGDQDE